MLQRHKNWIEKCETARGIEADIGTEKALEYLVEDTFLNFLAAAEYNTACQAEIPAFVSQIKKIFEPYELKECLATARQTIPFDPNAYEDAEEAELAREAERRRSVADLVLVERATEWLLGDGE